MPYKNKKEIQRDANHFMELEDDKTDCQYAVMRYRDGMTLTDWVQKNYPHDKSEKNQNEYVWNCIGILRDLSACVEHYQKEGLIHFDVKPDNVYLLKDNNGKYIVRLIDYDSVMSKDEFLEISRSEKKISMYSTKEYYGEEVWSSLPAWKKYATEETWPQVDVYALGTIFGYMLLGYTPRVEGFGNDFSWFCDNDPVIPKTSVRREVLIGFINKTRRIFGSRYQNASNWKFVLENIQALFCNDNYLMFDGFQQYRKELVPELIVGEKIYSNTRSKAPIEQVFDEYVRVGEQNICLVAESGMGKSTALRKLFLTKILEDQSDCRFYYYPLRECRSASVAKRLQREIENLYDFSKSDTTKKYFVLDAFDELDEKNPDLLKAVKGVLQTRLEDVGIILTSRYEIKEIDFTCIKTDALRIKHFDERLRRICENSSWLQDAGIDVFCNPLFITMVENFERIKNYIIHDKDTGELAWSNIEKELIGEYRDGKLTVNYAGELIWNYVHVSVLIKYVFSNSYYNVIEILNDPVLLNDEGFYNAILDKTNYAYSYQYWEEKNDVIFKNVFLELKNLLNHNELLIWFFKAKSILSRKCASLYIYQDDNFAGNGENYAVHRKTVCIWNLLLEMSGSKYNKFDMYEDYCETNIDQDAYEQYINEIYIGNRQIIFKGNIFLSRFQEAHRYFIYANVNCFNAIYLLLTQSVVNNINFSNLNLKSLVLRFGKFERIWKLNYFNTVNYCCFSNCGLQIISGNFNHCVFINLKEGSYLFPQIYKNNIYDKKYEIVDSVGNIISLDSKEVIQIIDGSTFPFDKYKDLCILAGALDNCVNKKIVIKGIKEIDLTNYKMLEGDSYDVSVPKLQTVVIFGNTIIKGFEYVANIEVYDNENYLFLDGILYDKNDKLTILHINPDLPNLVHFIASNFCAEEKYQVDHIGCKEICLYKDNKKYDKILNYESIKPFIGLERISNLPYNYRFIFNCLVEWEIVMGKVKNGKILACFNDVPILYIPTDFGLLFCPYGFWIKKTCKVFSPVKYLRTEINNEVLYKAKNSLKDLECDHTFDFYFGMEALKIYQSMESLRCCDLYKNRIINEYDDLTEEEKKSIMHQRSRWIGYIKSLQ